MEISCDNEAVLGMGFDSIRGEFRSVSVEGDATNPGTTGQAGNSVWKRVESWADISRELKIEAEASAQFGIAGGSAKFSFAEKMRTSSHFTTMIISVTASNPLTQIPRARLTTEARDLLKAGKTEQFGQRFGDMFIRGLRTGGEFYGFVQIVAKSKEMEKQISGEIEANYATASAKVSSSFSEKIQRGELSIAAYAWQTGGTVQAHTNIDTMCEAARSFGQSVRDQSFTVGAIVDNYTELDLPDGPSPVAREEKRSFLMRMTAFMNSLRQLSKDIDFALLFPDYFESLDVAALNEYAKQVDAARNEIKRRVESCLANIANCDSWTPALPPVSPIVRKTLIDAEQHRKFWEKIISANPVPRPKGPIGGL
jgi:hypothetical protein